MTTVMSEVRARAATAPATAAVGERELLAALSTPIAPVRVGAAYQAGMLAVAAVMVVLPLIYLAIVCLAAYGVYWHAVNNVTLFDGAGRSSGRGNLFLYLAPIVGGGVLVAFMIKPLFAKRTGRMPPLTLSQSEQRLLYTYVNKLCDLVGARRPSRIDVDCDVNASAGFREGIAGFLKGDVVLKIGLPLGAGLDLRQLTGVLAHEFGHFAQGTGLRLTYVVRSINGWFARVVYERDAWDEVLVTVSRGQSHVLINACGWLARGTIWLTRRVLWLLMITGHLVSSFMLRQMEFDADRYEARVAGADAFAVTSERMVMLTVAQEAAFHDLSDAWRERRLCDDLISLVLTREAELPADVRAAVRKNLAEEKTKWHHSHPAATDRIASARREGGGMFRLDAPATVLFHDFGGLCRRATESLYREHMGALYKREHLMKTEVLVTKKEERKEAQGSLTRFFQGLIDPTRAVFLKTESDLPADRDAAAEPLLAARRRLRALAPKAREAAARCDAANEELFCILQARVLRIAGGGGRAAWQALRLPGAGDDAGLDALERQVKERRQEAIAAINEILDEALRRIAITTFLEKPAAAAPPAAGDGEYGLAEDPASRDPVLAALAALAQAWPAVTRLGQGFNEWQASLVRYGHDKENAMLLQLVKARWDRAYDLLVEAYRALGAGTYPYGHAEGPIPLSRFVLEQVPPKADFQAVHAAVADTLQSVYLLYVRMMGDVAHRAEEVERGLGVDPLPEPEPAKEGTAEKA
jgi:hypothetical protein